VQQCRRRHERVEPWGWGLVPKVSNLVMLLSVFLWFSIFWVFIYFLVDWVFRLRVSGLCVFIYLGFRVLNYLGFRVLGFGVEVRVSDLQALRVLALLKVIEFLTTSGLRV
jgi:hypothetical protein